MSSKRKVVHVVPNTPDGGWDVKEQGSSQPRSHHRTKERAVDAGRRIAQQAVLGQLKIHKQDGTIQTEHTYGEDPRRYEG